MYFNPLVFMGGGHLAQALIGGLLEKHMVEHQAMLVVDPNDTLRERLTQEKNLRTQPILTEVLGRDAVVVLAVKPQVMQAVCAQIRPFVGEALIISVAAGIRVVDLVRWLGTDRVVRTMPNTPALVGAGMTGMSALPDVKIEDRELVKNLFSAVGEVLWVEQESMLDAITALSGSGPAYVFYVMEAMESAATSLGLSAEEARRLIFATFSGALSLARTSPDSLRVLREKVTSPNGTTFAALTHMHQAKVGEGIIDGIYAAARRSAELGLEWSVLEP